MIWNDTWALFAWWTFYCVENHLPFVHMVMHHLAFLMYWSNVYSIFVQYQGPLCNSCADACDSIWKFGIVTVTAWHCWFERVMNSVNFNIFASVKHILIPTSLVLMLMSVITGLYRVLCFIHYFHTFKQHGSAIIHFII